MPKARRRARSKRNGIGKGTRRSGAGRREAVRFAVIGQGHFAQVAILPAFENVRGAVLTAIFSEDATKLRALKRKYRVEHALSYDEYDEFLASGAVDAVYIALPNDLHPEYTERAARAGVHVLCEKPAAVTSEEAERMIAVCAENRVKLMIAYRLHFEEANLTAIDLIQKGKIGEPRLFSSTFSLQVRKENIRTQAERGGGPLHDLGVYCVNAARYLFRAEPIEVMAMAGRKAGDARFKEIDEQVSVLMKFPEDRVAQFTCSFGAYDQGEYTVLGTKGQLRLSPAYDYAVDLAMEVEANGKKTEKTFKKRDQIAAEIAELAACIREDREPEPNGREGLADLRVLDAIIKSIETGKAVRVEAVSKRRRPTLAQERRKPGHGQPEIVNAAPGHAE